MPTYEYECRECGHSFETVQNMSDEPLKDCPRCGKSVRRLIFGGSGVIFKGSGFYVNDAKGAKSTANGGTAKDAPVPATGSEKPVSAEAVKTAGNAAEAAKTASASSTKESA